MSVQRVVALAVVAIGVLVAWLYLVVSGPWLVVVGVFLLGLGVSWLLEIRRRKIHRASGSRRHPRGVDPLR